MAETGNVALKEDDIRFDESGERLLYKALERFWHPVLYARELVEDKPVPATLLGEPLVVARLGGEARAFRDLCPHRGTAISLGWVEDDALRCAYHGWKFGSDGMCTEIPARFGTKIPGRARLTAYPTTEQAGMIWVCLSDEPELPVPQFPQYTDPAFRIVTVDSYDWNCALPRRIENYVDFAHFAWVHDGVLGDRNQPEVPDHGIDRVAGELRFDHPGMAEPPSSGKNKALDSGEPVEVKIDYRLFMPNTVLLDQWMPSLEQRYLLFFAVCPTGPKTCRSFTLMGRDYSFDERTDQEMLDFNALVIGQDLPLVQSQRPEELPMDLSAEIQIRGADRVAVEYRRWLREIAYA